MPSYTMTDAQSARYDADDLRVYDEILADLGLAGWTRQVGTSARLDIYHADGFLAEAFYAPETISGTAQ